MLHHSTTSTSTSLLATSTTTNPKRWNLYLSLALGILLWVTFSPVLGFQQFVYDASRLIEKQPVVRGSWSISRILRTDYWGRTRENSIGSYRPFAVAQLWLEYQLWGKNVRGFAITQLLWMWLVCLLVVLFCRQLRLSFWMSWGVGFCFALHPAHTEIVANVAGRADLLMACLFLIGLWLHQHKHPWAMPCNLFVLFFGLASKELFVVFPVAAFLLDWLGPRATTEANTASSAPIDTSSAPESVLGRLRTLPWFSYFLYVGVTLLFFWTRHQTLGTVAQFPHGSHDNPLLTASFATRFYHAPMILGRYLELLIAPFYLSPDRTFQAVPMLTSPWDGRWWMGLFALLGFGWLIYQHRRSPIIRTTALFGLLFYLPISNTLVAGPIIMADRWLFLVSLPFCIGLVLLFCALLQFIQQYALRWRWLWFSFGVVYLLMYAGITYDYTWHWRSSLTLFRYASVSTPNSVKARYIHAQELLWAKQPHQALPEFQAALRIQPDFDLATFGMSEVYEQMGQIKQAEEILRGEVQRAGLQSPNARIRLVLFLRRHQRWTEAQQVDLSIRRDFARWIEMMQRSQSR